MRYLLTAAPVPTILLGFSDLGLGVSPLCRSLLTQEKGAVTPQETDPDLSVSVQESLEEIWVSSGLLQGRGH